MLTSPCALAKTGMGKHIEHYHRTIAFDSLLGGGTPYRELS